MFALVGSFVSSAKFCVYACLLVSLSQAASFGCDEVKLPKWLTKNVSPVELKTIL